MERVYQVVQKKQHPLALPRPGFEEQDQGFQTEEELALGPAGEQEGMDLGRFCSEKRQELFALLLFKAEVEKNEFWVEVPDRLEQEVPLVLRRRRSADDREGTFVDRVGEIDPDVAARDLAPSQLPLAQPGAC